ncbi:MAG: hypothetical protein Q7S08_04515 [bacterium]|nr:hypothetical protein [bacterium]
MSNPFEGERMDKIKQPDLQEIMSRANASREALKQRNPEFLAEKKPETATPPPSTTEEHLRRIDRAEKKKRVDPDAAAHDFHQRRLLGKDFE